jgi:hypothetical protein
MSIACGDTVEVINAWGERSVRVAATGVFAGRDFPVVRVCSQDEWAAAAREGREPEGVPWPAEDVRLVANAVG